MSLPVISLDCVELLLTGVVLQRVRMVGAAA